MAKKYKVIRGIENDALKKSYEPGEIVTLGNRWNVKWLLSKGAIEEVKDGDREDA